MKILIGHTGFVGSNLLYQNDFEGLFNSKNIQESFGLNPDILVYSGVRAEKFLANSEPENDFLIIQNAIENIRKINPKKVILISTIDVYNSPIFVNENNKIDESELQPYGKNRLFLEKWVENNFDNHLIVRLPALFGKNLKKNFIYDIINIVPSMLNENLYKSLSSSHSWIEENYMVQANGFYKLNQLSQDEKNELKRKFIAIDFTALNFTDSRGVFQFYNLKNLWRDIQNALQNEVKKINLATEPVSVSEIYESIYNKEFKNELGFPIPNYNFQTIYSNLFNISENYIENKKQILKEIQEFVIEERK